MSNKKIFHVPKNSCNVEVMCSSYLMPPPPICTPQPVNVLVGFKHI